MRGILRRYLMITATLPLVALGLGYGFVLAGRSRTDAEESLHNAAQDIAHATLQHLVLHRQAIGGLAAIIQANGAFAPPTLKRTLDIERAQFPAFLTMIATDHSGRVIAASGPDEAAAATTVAAAQSVADRDYYQQPLATGRTYVSHAFRGRGLGNDAIIGLSAPLHDPAGHFLGVVEGSLDLTNLVHFTRVSKGGPLPSAVVLDPEGHVAYSTDPRRFAVLATTASNKAIAAFPPPKTSEPAVLIRLAPMEHQQLIVGTTFTLFGLPGTWTVYTMEDANVVLDEARGYWLTTSLAVAFVLLICYFLSRRLAARVTRPLEQLATSIQQLSLTEGADFTLPLMVEGISEIEGLSEGFTSMVTRLDASYRELSQSREALRHSNTSLEEQVASRTAQLAAELTHREEVEAVSRRLALVAKYTSNLAVVTDASGAIEWANRTFTRVTGYTLEEVRGRKPGSFLQGPDTDPATIAHIRECLRNGRGFHVEILNYNRHGQPYWLEIDAQPVRDAADHITHFVAVESDITARRAAEAELRSYQERLELALNSARTCTWDNDVAGNHVTLDARWAVMLGGAARPTHTTVRKLLADVHPEDRTLPLHAGSRVEIGPDNDYEIEQRVRTIHGDWIWIRSVGRVVSRDDHGRATRMIGTNTDITAHKRAETELLHQKDFLATLQQATLDLLGHRDLNAVFQTLVEQACALLHAPFGELLLKDGEDLVLSASTKHHESKSGRRITRDESALIWQAHDTGAPVVTAHSTSHPFPQHHTPEVAIRSAAKFPIMLNGSCGGVLWVARDASGSGFSERDLNQGVLLAQAAALVLHNAGVRDAALREAAERTAALRESEARFRSVFDHSPIIIALTSVPEGRVVELNAAGLATFGGAREKITGKTTLELNLWADPADRTRYVELLHTHGVVHDFEVRLRRINGEEVSALCSGSIVQIGGRPYCLNSIQDISARKRAEVALRESEERFRSVFDRSPVPIALAEFPAGAIVAVNDAVLAAWGRPREEIVGRTAVDLGLWRDAATREAVLERMARDGSVHNLEARVRRHDGRDATILFGSVVVSLGGRPYSLNTFLDITERKAFELERDRSLSLMRATLESTADGILVVNGEGHLETFNGIFAEMWPLAPDQPCAANEDHIVRAILDQLADPAKFLESIVDLYRQSDQAVFDVLDCKDGRVFERYSRPHRRADRPSGRVWSFRDVTARRRAEEDRKKLEAQIRQSQKIESLGTLAGGIAHDFNNILTGIFGYVELARMDLPAGHASQAWLAQVVASGERAKKLVQQILTFSRKHEGERMPQHLDSVVAEALRLLRSTLPAMVELESRIIPPTPVVLADATQVHQVVMNLCTNAWHALPEAGGRIVVTLDACTLTPAEAATLPDLAPGPYLRLSVTDNGTGMSAATLDHIFEPFFTTKETGKGTGLGLAVVHGIVKAHDGAIAVHSTLGEGTTFELYFPAVGGTASPVAPVEAPEIPVGHHEHVLLVDDDPISGLVIQKLIESLRYRVTHYTDPRDAFARFQINPAEYDVVVVDLAMPGLPGDLLAREILRLRPAIPVAMVSGYIDPARLAAIENSGIRAIIRKPPTRGELARQLQLLLNGLPEDSALATHS